MARRSGQDGARGSDGGLAFPVRTVRHGANSGDCGIAYLFVDRRQDPPAVAMFRQCS